MLVCLMTLANGLLRTSWKLNDRTLTFVRSLHISVQGRPLPRNMPGSVQLIVTEKFRYPHFFQSYVKVQFLQ